MTKDEIKKAKRKAYKAKYYQENKEDRKAHKAKYYQENREQRLKQQAKYYQENKDKILKQQAKYHQENPERQILYQAIQRCHNPNDNRYEDYGLNGVKVSPRWRCDNGLENFIADMGKRPSPDYDLHRLDSDYGYSKSNCVWIHWLLHRQIHSGANWIYHAGKLLCHHEWSRELGLNNSAVRKRINQFGWSELEAVSIPKGMTRKQYYSGLMG